MKRGAGNYFKLNLCRLFSGPKKRTTTKLLTLSLPAGLIAQRPFGSIAQSVERCIGQCRRGHGFESRSSLIFFVRLSFRSCLSSVGNCDGLSFIFFSSAVKIYEFRIFQFD